MLNGETFADRGLFDSFLASGGVEDDADTFFVLGCEFANRHLLRAGCCLPVDVSRLVLRLIFAKRQQIAAHTAFGRGDRSKIERYRAIARVESIDFRENDKFSLARRKTASMSKKAERELGRKLKITDHQPPAIWKYVIVFSFLSLPGRDVYEMIERAPDKRRTSESRSDPSRQHRV